MVDPSLFLSLLNALEKRTMKLKKHGDQLVSGETVCRGDSADRCLWTRSPGPTPRAETTPSSALCLADTGHQVRCYLDSS